MLAILGRQDNLAQAELAALLEIGKVAVGGLIARLEALNFVERRPGAKDRPIKRGGYSNQKRASLSSVPV